MVRDPELLEQLRQGIRTFVWSRLVPLEAQVAETDEIPEAVVDEMRQLGLFGLSVPEEYGGVGLTMEEECVIGFELGQTSPAFRSVFGTNVGIGSQGIVMDGTEEQRRRFLPGVASGAIITSFALTEPDSGSDAASLRTTARREGDQYVLNGVKRYITNASRADLFTLMARTDPNQPGAAGISAFLVPRTSPGLTVGPPDHKMGQQGTRTADVILDDCRIPASALLGGVEGQGFKTAMKVLDRGRLHISSICCGTAERLIREMVGFATGRRQFGRPIAEFQLIQAMIADSRTEANAGWAMVLECARKRDRGENVTLDAAACKLFCAEMVGRVADRAVQVHGGAGYIRDYPVERFYRDVRLFRLYEGTSQILQLVVARETLKQFAG